VAFPTETVYGLGADALNPEAVAKIFILKERPSFDPLIIHISDISQARLLTRDFNIFAQKLAQSFWPGPLTIVMPKNDIVPDIVTSGLPTVGIRMPDNPVARDLIELSDKVLAAPSANKFGRISPTTAAHVKKQLPDTDCILDGGACSVGIESTVVSLNHDGFVILREGFITYEDLSKVVPPSNSKIIESPPASPGLLKSHYSPEKPIFIGSEKIPEEFNYKKASYLSFSGKVPPGITHTEFLSRSSDLKEAAVNLFRLLHKLEDDPRTEYIIAEPVPETGIGNAIMDKLRKASYKYNK
jgi:L-threonylcarbamoyladenylate synthase